MKNITFLIFGLSMLLMGYTATCNTGTEKNSGTQPETEAKNTLQIRCSSDLFNLASTWAAEFSRINPDIRIQVLDNSDEHEITGNYLSLISDEVSADNTGKWKMVIGREPVVPIINAQNPYLKELNLQGISSGSIAQLLSNPQSRQWSTLTDGITDVTVNLYIIDNADVKSRLGFFTKSDPEVTNGVIPVTSAELISTIQKDRYAIGFCRLSDVLNTNQDGLTENIAILPVDKNGNGRLDNFEKIYGSLDNFTRGVWLGKYPQALQGRIYATSIVKPSDKNELAFLTWILDDGQQFLNSNGFTELAMKESQANTEALLNPELILAQPEESDSAGLWLIVIVSVVIVAFAMTYVIKNFRNIRSNVVAPEIQITNALNEKAIFAPKGLYFDKSHTWAFMEKDGTVRVGIDDFLQHITGTITRLNLKEPGEHVRKGEKVMTIVRNGKQLNIYSPVSGTIMEQNKSLLANPALLNSSPYRDGWIYMLEPKNWLREIQFMFMAEKYKEWLRDEFSRLRDFFAASVKSNTGVYAHIILQDGGELTDNVLADLEPEVWEDFQTKFIDTSI
ncbi:MAG: hypothetical protein AB9834_00520 [Lentimicrobium sp.]